MKIMIVTKNDTVAETVEVEEFFASGKYEKGTMAASCLMDAVRDALDVGATVQQQEEIERR